MVCELLEWLFQHVTLGCVAQYKHRKHDHLIFYDSWVSRDLSGIPFANSRPFVLHQVSIYCSSLPFQQVLERFTLG